MKSRAESEVQCLKAMPWRYMSLDPVRVVFALSHFDGR